MLVGMSKSRGWSFLAVGGRRKFFEQQSERRPGPLGEHACLGTGVRFLDGRAELVPPNQKSLFRVKKPPSELKTRACRVIPAKFRTLMLPL